MSLLDDKRKAVELFIENLYTGSITSELFDITNVGWHDDGAKDHEYKGRSNIFNSLMPDIEKWLKLRSSKDNEEFTTTTESLFNRFLRVRTAGWFRGSFKEISQLEEELKTCRKDNEQMAQELSMYRTTEASRKQEFPATR